VSTILSADSNGKSDPYCKIFEGGKGKWHEIHTTRIINANLSPKWRETIVIEILNFSASFIKIVVWDKDKIGSDFLGKLKINVNDIDTEYTAKWYPLKVHKKDKLIAQGELRLKLQSRLPLKPADKIVDTQNRLQDLLSDARKDLDYQTTYLTTFKNDHKRQEEIQLLIKECMENIAILEAELKKCT